jgi:membrane peptidoglycan carboxypeptidase
LVSKGFRIEKYGLANLQMLNDTFVYNVYEKNELVNSFEISPENPNFISFAEIPSILTYSVLTSEDGGFFHHRGFSEESFKKAISDNLKEGRFARGGSTITMQLVKNVFLNKNKTISRKLEEMLIVWMIENMHLVSKERMLEVYLNIIEWGPNVYGIKQASKYYFNKQPKDLSLQECIFLASIIPSPKKFKYAFKAPGKLNDYYAWFYKRIPEVMIRREQLSPNDTIGLKPEVALKGEAKNYIEMDSVLNAKFFQYEGNDDE